MGEEKKRIIVRINGIDRQIIEGTTVEGLLKLFKVSSQGIAVDLNREVVCKHCYPETVIKEGDVVEIVKMVGGG